MDYVLLNSEIETDPESVGYSTMTDAEISASLSAPTILVRQLVEIGVLRDSALRMGVYTAILAAQKNPQLPGELWAVCETVLSLVSIGVESVNMDDPTSAMMFGALRQGGIISPTQAEAIDALATRATISRAEQIGLGAIVTVDDIERSRIVPQLDGLRARLANGYNSAVTALDAAQAVPEWSDLIAVIEAA